MITTALIVCLTCVVVSDVGADRAVQLLAPDKSHKFLQLNEDGLEVLRNIEGPIAVVSVLGSIHTGKSFFLNKLLDIQTGFKVGYGVHAQTEGVWFWDKPIHYNGVNIVLLDSEGFNGPNVDAEYDAKLFSIAALISTEILFNSVKFIDQHQLEYLELLSRRASIFALRAYAHHQSAADNSEDANVTGSHVSIGETVEALLPDGFTWVVQDFVQDLDGTSPVEWLLSLLDQPIHATTATPQRSADADGMATDGDGDQAQRPASTSGGTYRLKDLFRAVDCLTLPQPTTESQHLQKLDAAEGHQFDPNYLAAIKEYRERLLLRVSRRPKRSKLYTTADPTAQLQRPFGGRDIEALLQFLVRSANVQVEALGRASAFPKSPSIIESFAKLQLHMTQKDLVDIFRGDARRALGLSSEGGSDALHGAAQDPSSSAAAATAQQQAGDMHTVPKDEAETHRVVESCVDTVQRLWGSQTRGLPPTAELSHAEAELFRRVDVISTELKNEACHKMSMFCETVSRTVLRRTQDKITKLQSSLPHPPLVLANHVGVGKASAHVQFDSVFASHGATSLRNAACCAFVVGSYNDALEQQYTALILTNDAAIQKSLAAAHEAARRVITSPLSLDSLQGAKGSKLTQTSSNEEYKTSESVFKGTLVRLESEAVSLFKTKVGILASTPEATTAQEALQRELTRLKQVALHIWTDMCAQAAADLSSAAVNRLPVAVRRRLPFPTTDDALTSTIAEQRNAAVAELQTLPCKESEVWNFALKGLHTAIQHEAQELDKQNVRAVKDLSQTPLTQLRAQLTVAADSYYTVGAYRTLAKTEGLLALRRASKAQGITIAEALEEKVVMAFINDDLQNDFMKIAFNLYRLLTFVSALVTATLVVFQEVRQERYFKCVVPVLACGVIIVDNVIRRFVLVLHYAVFSLLYSLTADTQGRGIQWFIILGIVQCMNVGCVVAMCRLTWIPGIVYNRKAAPPPPLKEEGFHRGRSRWSAEAYHGAAVQQATSNYPTRSSVPAQLRPRR